MAQRGPKPKPVELREHWLEQFRSGTINLAELARRAGVSVSTVHRELRRRGVETAGYRGGRRTPLTVARRVVALYRRGLSLRRVAQRTGLSAEGARKVLQRAGVQLRPRAPSCPLRDPYGRPIRLRRFGPRLRALRQAAGLSRAQLAAQAGLHPLTVGALEAGRQTPQWTTLKKLAGALGVNLAAFGVQIAPPP